MENENLIKHSQQLSPTVWIGKNGLDHKLIEEIKLQLKKRKLVKVKLLKGAIDEQNIDRKTIPNEIARLTDSVLILKVGFVFTLYKER